MTTINELLVNLTNRQIQDNLTTIYNCSRILNDIQNLQIKIAHEKTYLSPERRKLLQLSIMQNQLEMLFIDYEQMVKIIR
jgi:hypothetical protein